MNGLHIGMAATVLIFGVIPVTAALFFYKLRTRQMETLLKLADSGARLDPETIRLMTGASNSYKTDYKWGLLWLALGIPVTLGLWVTSGPNEAIWGLIPIAFGIAFLVAGKLRLRGAAEDPTAPSPAQ